MRREEFPDDLAADARLLLRAMRATEDARGPRTDETNESRSLPRSVRCRCARSRRARRTTRDARSRGLSDPDGDDGSRCGVRNGRVRQRADAGILWTPRTGETGVSSRIYQRGVEDIAVRRYSPSQLLLHKDEDPKFAQLMRIKNPKNRLKKLTDACKTKTVCPYTGTAQPQYRLEGMKITAEFKQPDGNSSGGGERKVVVTAERALQILKGISDEDCRVLGLDPEHARPDWFILQVMPVPPPGALRQCPSTVHAFGG